MLARVLHFCLLVRSIPIPATIQSTGDIGLDRELDFLLQQIKALSGTSAQATVTTVTPSQPTLQAALVVQDVSGTVSLTLPGLLFDDTDGFAISQENGLARIDRTATTNAPPTGTGVAGAGTATDAANSDHTHASVTSLTASGNLVAASAAHGAITVTVKVPMVASDPVSPAAGDLWYRTDTDELKVYTGSAVKKSAAFT